MKEKTLHSETSKIATADTFLFETETQTTIKIGFKLELHQNFHLPLEF